MAQRKVPVQMDEELRSSGVRGTEHRRRLEAGYRQLPTDLGAYIHVDRILADVPNGGGVGSSGLAGHVLDIEFLNSAHTKLSVRKGLGDDLSVSVDGVEVYRWTKLVGGSSRVVEPAGEVGSGSGSARSGRTGGSSGVRRPSKAERMRAARAAAAREVVDDDEIE